MTIEQIKGNIINLHNELPIGVKLVAVSKFHPIEALLAAYDGGQHLFGESRAQEIGQKHSLMPSDVQWHFIGHLQSNKVRQIVPYVSLIHSIDSEKLLRCVDAEARRIGRIVDVLLQLHVAKETTKYGLTIDECRALVDNGVTDELKNVRICGVMGMATNTEDEAEIGREFHEIRSTFDVLKDTHFRKVDCFDTVSMGMSEDYHIAVAEGTTMVRIGTTIFGEREY